MTKSKRMYCSATSLKLYRISQTANNNYDTFDAMIVAAYSEEEAQHTKSVYGLHAWTTPGKVKVELIGSAINSLEPGIVLGSFNAG